MSMRVLMGVFLLLVLPFETKAQGCCSATVNGQGGLARGVMDEGRFLFAAMVEYLDLSDTYEGREVVHEDDNRHAAMTFINVQLEYGISDRVTLLASWHHSSRSRDIAARGIVEGIPVRTRVELQATGWGDVLLLGKVAIISPDIVRTISFAIGAGATLPTGSTSVTHGGAVLPQDMQPGLGAPTLLTWGRVSAQIMPGRLGWSASAHYRYKSSNLDGYRTGDELTVTGGMNVFAFEQVDIGLQAQGRFLRRDFANRRLLDGTGGTLWDILPSLSYSEGSVTGRMYMLLPLYRNVPGRQLTTSLGIGAELQYTPEF